MLNEIGEFKAYTAKPVYRSTGKRDTAWLGRFTFNTFLDFEGLGRILTIVARGYLFRDGTNPYENIEYARNALCAWCSIPAKSKKAPEAETEPKVNFGHLSNHFPELVDEKGNGWFHRHVKNVITLNLSASLPRRTVRSLRLDLRGSGKRRSNSFKSLPSRKTQKPPGDCGLTIFWRMHWNWERCKIMKLLFLRK